MAVAVVPPILRCRRFLAAAMALLIAGKADFPV